MNVTGSYHFYLTPAHLLLTLIEHHHQGAMLSSVNSNVFLPCFHIISKKILVLIFYYIYVFICCVPNLYTFKTMKTKQRLLGSVVRFPMAEPLGKTTLPLMQPGH